MAALYDQQGMVREALEHALAGEQIEYAVRLFERHGAAEAVITRLEELLEGWAKQGREARAPDARLLLAKLHGQAGRHEQALTVLQRRGQPLHLRRQGRRPRASCWRRWAKGPHGPWVTRLLRAPPPPSSSR